MWSRPDPTVLPSEAAVLPSSTLGPGLRASWEPSSRVSTTLGSSVNIGNLYPSSLWFDF